MRWIVEEVPWGNLIRTLVSTAFFALCIGMPIAMVTTLDEGRSDGVFHWVVVTVGFVLASIVVWSDTVPWIGDA